MTSKALTELGEKLAARQKAVADILATARTAAGDYDFASVKDHGIDGDNAKGVEVLRTMNAEMEDLAAKVDAVKELDGVAERAKALGEMFNRPASDFMQPGGGAKGADDPDFDALAGSSMGRLFTGSKAFKGWRPGMQQGPVEDIDLGEAGVKTLMATTAGWAPESLRTGRLVDKATRPIQILDVIPSTVTGMAAVKYMEETTMTNSAAETAEGAAYAASAFAFTERSVTVEKIAVYLPVTDEQLEDVPQVRGYVDNRLGFGLRQRLDGQLTNGDGVTPNILGILNKGGIQTQAKGTDDQLDALFKAQMKVRQTGRANPDTYMLESIDYQDIRLKRTADGIYLLGNPTDDGPTRLWGLNLVINDSLPNGTGLVGDFGMFSEISIRRNIAVQVGYQNDDFVKGIQCIRADMRACAIWYRAAAFCTVTGI